MRILEWLRTNIFNTRLRTQIQELRQKQEAQASELATLSQLVTCKIHKYECVICREEFARLPHQSNRRCSACMREIQETAGISNGNGQHRQAGHSTRNQHKNHPAVKT